MLSPTVDDGRDQCGTGADPEHGASVKRGHMSTQPHQWENILRQDEDPYEQLPIYAVDEDGIVYYESGNLRQYPALSPPNLQKLWRRNKQDQFLQIDGPGYLVPWELHGLVAEHSLSYVGEDYIFAVLMIEKPTPASLVDDSKLKKPAVERTFYSSFLSSHKRMATIVDVQQPRKKRAREDMKMERFVM
ncbi:hypothetical protein SLS56_010538 [Neofusicoccum ribis]|uniref:Uncharacterized protein n=1 Tax=Neofusicoccum ribis TaxID=45134 RepID=A0ABR3SE72_9PEZI